MLMGAADPQPALFAPATDHEYCVPLAGKPTTITLKTLPTFWLKIYALSEVRHTDNQYVVAPLEGFH